MEGSSSFLLGWSRTSGCRVLEGRNPRVQHVGSLQQHVVESSASCWMSHGTSPPFSPANCNEKGGDIVLDRFCSSVQGYRSVSPTRRKRVNQWPSTTHQPRPCHGVHQHQSPRKPRVPLVVVQEG